VGKGRTKGLGREWAIGHTNRSREKEEGSPVTHYGAGDYKEKKGLDGESASAGNITT